jgi:hypothetical protein
MTTPTESPYHHSRARVLTAYAAMRRLDILPIHAMEAILSGIHRDLIQLGLTTPERGHQRREAALEWDRHHARRYLGIIDLRRQDLPYWKRGRLS